MCTLELYCYQQRCSHVVVTALFEYTNDVSYYQVLTLLYKEANTPYLCNSRRFWKGNRKEVRPENQNKNKEEYFTCEICSKTNN